MVAKRDLDPGLVDRLGNGFGLRRKYQLEVDFACQADF